MKTAAQLLEIEEKVNKAGAEIFRCPICNVNSDSIIWGTLLQQDTGEARGTAECQFCGAHWTELYDWAGISGLKQ